MCFVWILSNCYFLCAPDSILTSDDTGNASKQCGSWFLVRTPDAKTDIAENRRSSNIRLCIWCPWFIPRFGVVTTPTVVLSNRAACAVFPLLLTQTTCHQLQGQGTVPIHSLPIQSTTPRNILTTNTNLDPPSHIQTSPVSRHKYPARPLGAMHQNALEQRSQGLP